uniref:Dual-specificity RNA methyltransferase RlmN n=1 Tax=Rhizophora mucronata TaxID=61149 RepID=A0A2P2M8S0_RHIMU
MVLKLKISMFRFMRCFYGILLIDLETHRSLQILFRLVDGMVIETVVIPCDRGRTTVCVSSQVGCAMNCQFCYTGRMGLKRHLTTAEIVEQVVLAQRLFTSEVGSITNVVFMGMGEPLQNIDNVIKAAEIMVDEQGLHLSPRKVTVSTSGLVPQLIHFLNESNCALAVSLNATTDEVHDIFPCLDLLENTHMVWKSLSPVYFVG